MRGNQINYNIKNKIKEASNINVFLALMHIV